MKHHIICFVALFFTVCVPLNAQQSDSEKLGMALEYFRTGKYHECMLLLEKLDKQYKLNPRFRAYLGICHYYEWNYTKASECLDSVIPALKGFAPHELSVYYWADAESHFNLKEYKKAIPLYENMLLVCFDNEKPDALFRLGFCYMYAEDWQNAYDYLAGSLAYYRKYRADEQQGRIAQIEKMLKGIARNQPENRHKNDHCKDKEEEKPTD